MPAITNTQSIRQSLQQLLQSAKEGKIQLPDFQRSWVWNDEQIRNLLASVSLSYPIGAVMMLETGNSAIRFKHRLVEGVAPNLSQPDQLLLDGQQRITSLFQVLLSEQPVSTQDVRGKEIHRWYYIDMAKALNPNFEREEAIIALPTEKIKRNLRGEILADYSTTDKECAAEVFPLKLVFDVVGQTQWMQTYLQLDANMQERLTRWTNFLQEVIQSFQQYQVPIILLSKDTPREAVCQVFEKVNTGGVSLTVFELITATYAADEFNLREDWAKREQKLKKLPVLGNVENTDFLQALTLAATRDRQEGSTISCTRKDILKLTLDEYKTWADAVTEGFEKAAKLLHAQKIFTAKDLPYQPQLTALAAIFAALGDRSMSESIYAKLARWYWCGVFGELYSSAIESRLAKDLPQVLHWIDGHSEPDTIADANFASNRLTRLYTRRSAAYKGLSALLLRDGGYDFLTGYGIDTSMQFGDSIDIHHIFPRHWCEKNGIKADLYDSAINKTPLSSRTNKIIGSNAPSMYLSKLQTSAAISESRMNELLRSHVIEPKLLRTDDFYNFLLARQKALLERIEKAMGKSLITDTKGVESEDLERFDSDEADN